MSSTALDIALLTSNVAHQNELLSLQNKILDEVVKAHKTPQALLNDLCCCAEALVPDALASVMLLDELQATLSVEAAPNVPKTVIADLKSLKPERNNGSCANAILSKGPIYVSNTLEDERWDNVKHIAEKYNITAGWSNPVFHKGKMIIGTFALCSFKERRPSTFQKNLMKVCANLVSIILYRKRQDEKLWKIAHHDALTGLPNRHFIDFQIKQAINTAKKSKKPLALMFIDMDNFKNINDSYGHDFGDEVLLKSMKIIKDCLRKGDIVARHGGDEFLLILENFESKSSIDVIANKILNEFNSLMEVRGHAISVHFSIGISLYPEDGTSYSELMKSADIAMYQAKAMGKNSVQYFRKELGESVIQKVRIEQEIREALDSKQFELYFQPQYEAKHNKIEALEVLLRWNHPDRGQLFPDEFISIAEQSQLIIALNKMVFYQACLQGIDWLKRGFTLPTLSLNLSSAQLMPGFSDWLAKLLKKTGFPAQHLELEITESSLMKYGDEAVTELNKICDMGVALAMDDFGTGYSSLSQLKKLPIDKLKIDQSFIKSLNQDDQTIVKTIITMGKNLGMRIVAEGVENERQQDLLLSFDCDIIQGYYRHKPVNAKEIEDVLTKSLAS